MNHHVDHLYTRNIILLSLTVEHIHGRVTDFVVLQQHDSYLQIYIEENKA